MRLLSITVLGTALITAGMVAPATATGHDGITVRPGVARPGQRVEISVPHCGSKDRAASDVFTGQVILQGRDGRGLGAATVKRDAKPDIYTITARCGGREVTGRFRVAGRLAWPAILPASLTPSRDGL